MAIAIAVVILGASLLVPLCLCAWAKFHWFSAWLVGAATVPAAIWLVETLEPSGWGWVIFFFWGIPAMGLAGLGAVLGRVIARKSTTHAAT